MDDHSGKKTNYHRSNNDDEEGAVVKGEGSPLLLSSSSNMSNSETTMDDNSFSSSLTSLKKKNQGRLMLLLVAFLYGSLSVSLRMVYARPGPPAASILSATRGWMTVVCLLPPIMMMSTKTSTTTSVSSSSSARGQLLQQARYSTSSSSFYWFAFELAVFNFGTQGLLNIGLLTTASARSAFFSQLSVVITPILSASIGALRRQDVVLKRKIWIACFVALFGLSVLSSDGSGDGNVDVDGGNGDPSSSSSSSTTNIFNLLSPGDLCCLASAFCWSYYIYRLSDWGDRYDETQTQFVKNIFMAILYSLWTIGSYYWSSSTNSPTTSLWEGWKDPISLSILFYTALSSGAISDIVQQKAQAIVPAAESNVILSLEPVFSAVLGLLLLAEIPSIKELIGVVS